MSNTRSVDSGVANVNGARIAYEIAGSGQALVLVHAGIADRRMWDEQFQVFAQHFQVIRYDMRGYGQTPAVEGLFSHSEDLYGLLMFLGIQRAYLLGCSQGGATIIDFALTHPQMVAGLITVCCAPSGHQFSGAPPRQWEELGAAEAANDLERAAELEVQIWVDGPQRTPEPVDAAIRNRVREMNMIALTNEWAGLAQSQPLAPPAASRLAELRVPMLVIIGDLDQPAMVAAGEQMAALVPQASKVVMKGTAHLPNMERPDDFNQIVLDFLASL